MPNIYFITFEILVSLQLAICLRHALKFSMGNLLKLLFGILFGLTLELATIRQLNAYQYGQFLVMVADVPLCIGVAWGCIIYSVMEFSDASNLPYWLRPILDGLLALNIDLALDAVAIRFGFWDWGMGLQTQYFGVPYANFWAWFWVVFSFSMGYRIFARRLDRAGIWVAPLAAFVIGLLGVLGTNAFIVFIVPRDIRNGLIATTLLTAFGIILYKRPSFHQRPVDPLVFWIPFLTHAYVMIAGIISGIIFNPIFLLIVGIFMLISAFYLHGRSIKDIFAKAKQPL